MPVCWRAQARDENTQDDGWREPPGWLGEAVRRAKLIPPAPVRAAPPPPPEGLPPSP
jgi:hypothetical protein